MKKQHANTVMGKQGHFRSGGSGGWAKTFSQEQSAEIDRQIEVRLPAEMLAQYKANEPETKAKE